MNVKVNKPAAAFCTLL